MATSSTWERFLAAIRAQESGNYSEDVAGCLGAYCWNAQTNWDDMARSAGESRYVGVNPSQVPAAVQDKVASTNLHRVYQQAGGGTNGYRLAAAWWNGGSTRNEPNPGLPAQPWAKDCGGGNSYAYACQILARMRLGGHYLSGKGSGAGGVVTTAAAVAADCAIALPSYHIGWFFGHGPTVGGGCILSKSQVRALLAIGNLTVGVVLMGVGFGFMAAFTRPGRQILGIVTSVAPAGRAARAAGAASAVSQQAGT